MQLLAFVRQRDPKDHRQLHLGPEIFQFNFIFVRRAMKCNSVLWHIFPNRHDYITFDSVSVQFITKFVALSTISRTFHIETTLFNLKSILIKSVLEVLLYGLFFANLMSSKTQINLRCFFLIGWLLDVRSVNFSHHKYIPQTGKGRQNLKF